MVFFYVKLIGKLVRTSVSVVLCDRHSPDSRADMSTEGEQKRGGRL